MFNAFIYIICILTSVFALSGINFNNFFKKDRVWEARVFIVLISLALGYLVGSLIIALIDINAGY